jgi:hypothetical protein
MPLTLNVGLSKKVGLPDYGSLGVSCNVEIELDATSLLNEPAGFQQKVKQVYAACNQAVQDELEHQQNLTHPSPTQPSIVTGNGRSTSSGHTNAQSGKEPRAATASQVRAIQAIANRQSVDLNTLLHSRFGVDKPASLTINQASRLIDDLKAAANGAGGGQ